MILVIENPFDLGGAFDLSPHAQPRPKFAQVLASVAQANFGPNCGIITEVQIDAEENLPFLASFPFGIRPVLGFGYRLSISDGLITSTLLKDCCRFFANESTQSSEKRRRCEAALMYINGLKLKLSIVLYGSGFAHLAIETELPESTPPEIAYQIATALEMVAYGELPDLAGFNQLLHGWREDLLRHFKENSRLVDDMPRPDLGTTVEFSGFSFLFITEHAVEKHTARRFTDLSEDEEWKEVFRYGNALLRTSPQTDVLSNANEPSRINRLRHVRMICHVANQIARSYERYLSAMVIANTAKKLQIQILHLT